MKNQTDKIFFELVYIDNKLKISAIKNGKSKSAVSDDIIETWFKKMAIFKVKNVKYSESTDRFLITFSEDFKVIINNATRFMQDYADKDFSKDIKETIINQQQQKAKSKKVKRSNKFNVGKIISIVLIAGIVTGVSVTSKKDNEIKDDISTNIENSYVDEIQTVTTIPITIFEKPEEIALLTEEEYSSVTAKEIEEDIVKIKLDYEDYTNSETAKYAKDRYWPIINKISSEYGLDSTLMLAIATQEGGENIDASAKGLMQIEKEAWSGQRVSAYNYETEEKESIIVDESRLNDNEYNVRVSCMIFQTYLKQFKYNLAMAITAYNMGVGSMEKILDAYCQATGKIKEQVLNNPSDTNWLNYRNLINIGDGKYLEHVMRYFGIGNIEILGKDAQNIVYEFTNRNKTLS